MKLCVDRTELCPIVGYTKLCEDRTELWSIVAYMKLCVDRDLNCDQQLVT